MIIDRYNEYSDAQALAAVAAASRNVSTNIIDLQAPGDAYGCLGDTQPVLQVRSLTAASGTATSVTITLECHTAADFSAARTVLATITTTVGAMTAGKVLGTLPIPFGVSSRYLAVVIVPNGGTLTSSTDVFQNLDLQRNDFRTSAVGQPA